jgi:allatostatin receptor
MMSGNLSHDDGEEVWCNPKFENCNFRFILYIVATPILFGLITLIGTIGNSMVIYVILSRRRMRTVTNFLLLNLAVADLSFVSICPPFTAYQFAARRWPFGDVVCKLMHYLLNVTAYVTVYTLVLIAVNRFMAILYNTQTVRFRTKRSTILMIICTWVVMLAVNSPLLLKYGVTVYDNVPDCDQIESFGQELYATFFVFAYLLPLIIITVLSACIWLNINSQTPSMPDKDTKVDMAKKNVSCLLIMVVVVFAICWLPIHIHLLMAYFGTISMSQPYQVSSLGLGISMGVFFHVHAWLLPIPIVL